jgi:hypothetical protein
MERAPARITSGGHAESSNCSNKIFIHLLAGWFTAKKTMLVRLVVYSATKNLPTYSIFIFVMSSFTATT